MNLPKQYCVLISSLYISPTGCMLCPLPIRRRDSTQPNGPVVKTLPLNIRLPNKLSHEIPFYGSGYSLTLPVLTHPSFTRHYTTTVSGADTVVLHDLEPPGKSQQCLTPQSRSEYLGRGRRSEGNGNPTRVVSLLSLFRTCVLRKIRLPLRYSP